MSDFSLKFENLRRENNSCLCIGLDPDLESMPIRDIALFNKTVIEATQDIVSAYKPNLAFYEQFGIDEEDMEKLAGMNDDGKSFNEIADYIETNILTRFAEDVNGGMEII